MYHKTLDLSSALPYTHSNRTLSNDLILRLYFYMYVNELVCGLVSVDNNMIQTPFYLHALFLLINTTRVCMPGGSGWTIHKYQWSYKVYESGVYLLKSVAQSLLMLIKYSVIPAVGRKLASCIRSYVLDTMRYNIVVYSSDQRCRTGQIKGQ